MENIRDKHKDFGILLEQPPLLKLSKEVIGMAENDPELLNAVYKEISEKLGMDTAMEIYRMFKGQQISFPTTTMNIYSHVLPSSAREAADKIGQLVYFSDAG